MKKQKDQWLITEIDGSVVTIKEQLPWYMKIFKKPVVVKITLTNTDHLRKNDFVSFADDSPV